MKSNSATLIEEIAKLEVPNNEIPASLQTCDFPEVTKEDDESYAKSSTSFSNPSSSGRNTVKVLGVNWDTVND